MGSPKSAGHLIDVVCLVLVDQKNHIFATQRPDGGSLARKWEFPGGKIENGEDQEAALRRELREELCIDVGALTPLSPVIHEYEFGTIRLWPFMSRCGEPPQIELVEHANCIWATLAEIRSLDWAPADVPILAELVELL